MENIKRTELRELFREGDEQPIGSRVCVKGWVRTKRGNKNVSFIALNDGSCIHNLQIVADMSLFDEDLMKRITTGACLKAV